MASSVYNNQIYITYPLHPQVAHKTLSLIITAVNIDEFAKAQSLKILKRDHLHPILDNVYFKHFKLERNK